MKPVKITTKTILLVCLFSFLRLLSQDLSELSNTNVDDLDDSQIEEVWGKAKESGYSIQQLVIMARSQGMSPSEIDKLKRRIESLKDLNYTPSSEGLDDDKKLYTDSIFKDSLHFGIDNLENFMMKKERSRVFGYDFFNNPNITFTPNIRLATPQSYIVGPGDILRMDIWGAAEQTYVEKITPEGFIKITGIGKININGLSIKEATSKINSHLSKIYHGIKATSGSYNKVYTSIVLESVRTVQVNLLGEVKVPGTYSLNGFSTVVNALYACGGPTEEGTYRQIKIIREGKLLSYFDFYNYYINGSEEGNIQLKDQDVIIVTPYINKVEVVGEVKREGIFELKATENFEDLLKYTSGFKPEALKNSILIERYSNTQKLIKEFDASEGKEIILKNGDKVIIKKLIDSFENRISLNGAVFYPGNYEYNKNLSLKDLLSKANGVKNEAYLDKAIIVRKKDKQDNQILSFSLKDVINGKSNIILKQEDSIYIYDKDELRGKRQVSISGAVNKPLTVDYIQGMKVVDLIALAGGFKEGADSNNIEISRRLDDEDFSTVAEGIVVSVNDQLKSESKDNFLQPFDVVTVRYKKGFSQLKNVSITGEVQFPGQYSIQHEEETISDLVRRAGGFSPYAYIDGATLIRKRFNITDIEQSNILKLLKSRDTLFDNVSDEKQYFKIGIDLNRIMKNQKSKIDLYLREADQIIVPKIDQTVEVQGMVFTPSLVQYIEGKRLRYYVSNSGGFLNRAKKSKVYVLYQNGEIKTTKRFLFFKSYPKIEAGATVLVPEKPESRKLITTQEIIGLTTGFTTLIILIDRLWRKN